MGTYVIYMMPGTSITAYLFHLHASVVAHMQDPYSEFHYVNIRTYRLLWSWLTMPTWVKFRDQYHDFMVIGAPGWDGPRFQLRIHE